MHLNIAKYELSKQAVWIAIGTALWCYALIRANLLSFTHDESLSYTIFTGDAPRILTSNHHHLNTWCMQWCNSLFGPSELSLRFGSLVAFALFLWGGLFLIKSASGKLVQWAGLALLLLNPFILDFFSLARGYSWAMAGAMGMLVSLHGLSASTGGRAAPWLRIGFLSAALATLGNLASLNLVVAYIAVVAVWMLRQKRFLPLLKWQWRDMATFAAFGTAFLFGLKEAFRLKESGEIYAGGRNGFMKDTIQSLVDCSLYSAPYAHGISRYGPLILAGVGISIILWALYGWIQRGRTGFFTLAGSLLLFSIVCIVAQHAFLRTPLPTDRMATYLLVVFGATVFAALEQLNGSPAGKIMSGALGFVLTAHFFITANTTHCYMWNYDRNTKKAMQQLVSVRNVWGRQVKMASHGLFEPAVNYYRKTLHYDWLEPIPGDGIKDRMADVYITLWDDFDRIPSREGLTEVISFATTRSAVWRRQ